MTLSQKILAFNHALEITEEIPSPIEVLNPFKGEHSEIINEITQKFYVKYYNDNNPRKLILGINPGRLGAGSTGIPFTDTKRLVANCNIPFTHFNTHEPSSVFIYDVIDAFGGPEKFYAQFYIGSVSPLGYVTPGKSGMVNINYYDNKNLEKAITPFIIKTINQQLDFGLSREKIFVLGTGKNFTFLNKLNQEQKFAKEIVPLEHPRFVMQYRSKRKEEFIDKYLRRFC